MSYRLEKINKLLKQQVSQILLNEIDFSSGVLVTVTQVETLINLQQAKIMISVLPSEQSEEVLKTLNRHIFDFQQILNKKLRMRPVPKISFQLDKSGQKQTRIIELLDRVRDDPSPLNKGEGFDIRL